MTDVQKHGKTTYDTNVIHRQVHTYIELREDSADKQ